MSPQGLTPAPIVQRRELVQCSQGDGALRYYTLRLPAFS